MLVTGASGGVGGTALAILADRGYEVWAATGKPDEAARLRTLGAAGILARDEVTGEGRPLESERWAGAVDAVGGATLPYVLRTLRVGGAVAASGNAGGAKLETTVFPFILRGVALLGMDSVNMPIAHRRELWDRLATDLRPRDIGVHCTEVTLDTLDEALDGIVVGCAREVAGSCGSGRRDHSRGAVAMRREDDVAQEHGFAMVSIKRNDPAGSGRALAPDLMTATDRAGDGRPGADRRN